MQTQHKFISALSLDLVINEVTNYFFAKNSQNNFSLVGVRLNVEVRRAAPYHNHEEKRRFLYVRVCIMTTLRKYSTFYI